MKEIQRFVVGSDVKSLEDGLFQDLPALREVDFANCGARLQIPKECFKGCTALRRCIYPGCSDVPTATSQQKICQSTFQACQNLTGLVMPTSIREIEENAFRGCKSLPSIDIGSSTTSVDQAAFAECESLQRINGGSGLKVIETSAFSNCTQLTSFSRFASADKTQTLNVVGEYAFANTGLKKANLSLSSTINSTWWGDYCFASCYNLEEVKFYNSIYLGSHMFEKCINLKKVEFDDGQNNYVGKYVFNGCSSLTSMTFSKKQFSFLEGMFKDCTSLKKIGFDGYDDGGFQFVQKNAFAGCSKLTSIEFPDSLNSLAKLDDACLSNCALTSINFHGLDKSEFEVTDAFPTLGVDEIDLNTVYSFSEKFYDFYDNYAEYLKIFAKGDEDKAYEIGKDYDFAFAHEYLEKNYITMHNILSVASQKNIPVVVFVTATHIEPNGPSDTDQNIFANSVDSTFLRDFRYLENAKRESYILKCKLGNKTTKYDLLIDYDLIRQHQDAAKQQLSAIMIHYNLDFGLTEPYSDPFNPIAEKYVDNESQYAQCVIRIVNDKLAKFNAKTARKLRKSALLSLSKDLLDVAQNVTHSKFRQYSNYNMVLVKRNATKKGKFSICGIKNLYNGKKFYKLIDSQKESLLKSIDEYNKKHPTEEIDHFISYIPFDIRNYNTFILHEEMTTLLNQVEKTWIQLDKSFCIPGTNTKLWMIKVADNYIGNGRRLLENGLFRLRHDCIITTKDGTKINWEYRRSLENDYSPKYEYLSDTVTKRDFKTPYQLCAGYKSMKAAHQAGKNPWYYNAIEVVQQAVDRHQPLLLMFSLETCSPCQWFKANLHENDAFQDWYMKQKFLLCRIEATKPKGYDQQLAYCEDVFSRAADNYISTKSSNVKSYNGFGETTADNYLKGHFSDMFSVSDYPFSLTPPCLVFYWKDSNGKVIANHAYSLHNLLLLIDKEKMGEDLALDSDDFIQLIKSLCLYHFEGNDLAAPNGIVHDAGKIFNKFDYQRDKSNRWKVAENLIDLNFSGLDTIAKVKMYMADALTQHDHADGVVSGEIYIQGCYTEAIDWLEVTFGALYFNDDKTGYDSVTQILDAWFIKVGNDYYKMGFDFTKKKKGNTCSFNSYIYKVVFTKTSYMPPLRLTVTRRIIGQLPYSTETIYFQQMTKAQVIKVDIPEAYYETYYEYQISDPTVTVTEPTPGQKLELTLNIPANYSQNLSLDIIFPGEC